MTEEAPATAATKVVDTAMDVEQLKGELEKERQSKSALENMIIVSSLNMIGKIELLEKKHEAQIEQLREQIHQYASKEEQHNLLTRSLEEANAKLRVQLADFQSVNKKAKGKRKDKEGDSHTNGNDSTLKKKAQSFSGNTDKDKKGRSAQAFDDDDRDLVAEALGTFGEIEKRPRGDGGHSSSRKKGGDKWDETNQDNPSQSKRRKTDPALTSFSPDRSPPQTSTSPLLSESQMNVYTSNYSNLFAASTQQYSGHVPLVSEQDRQTQGGQLLQSDDSEQPQNQTRDQSLQTKKQQAVALTSALQSPNSPHEKMLNDVHQLQITQKERLERMQQTQKHLLSERTSLGMAALETEQQQLRSQMEGEVNTLRHLDKTVMLEPNQLFRLDFLLQDLRIQQRQLELFQSELQQFISATLDSTKCHAALVITKQPFPMVISKFKQLQEEQLVVQLLSGANVDFISFSTVKAELICHTKAITKGTSTSSTNPNASLKKHIDRDTQPLDLLKGISKFPLKFLTGTRKSCVNLRFVVQVKTSAHTLTTIESNTSQPFIVITNDCQWEGSEGTLLKNEAFNDQIEIPWAQFVNILQRHFLKATRQSPIQPTRPLSLYDFSYLSAKFFTNKGVVSHKSFDNFWGWFGKSLQTLRYKRHISTLWQNGLIFMFLTREKVSQILRGQEPGVFIILFSEAYPGQLEISYVAAEKQGTPPSSPGPGHHLANSSNDLSHSLNSTQNLSSSVQNVHEFTTNEYGTSNAASHSPVMPGMQSHASLLLQSSGSTPVIVALPTPQLASTEGVHANGFVTPSSHTNLIATAVSQVFPLLTPLSPIPPSISNDLGTSTKPLLPHLLVTTPPLYGRNPLTQSVDGAAHISTHISNSNNNNNGITGNTNGLSRSASSVLLNIATTPLSPSNLGSFGSGLSSSHNSMPHTSYACTSAGYKIKHYLVQPNDTSGSKRTLPDFLNECPQFTHILQLNVAVMNTTTDWMSAGMPAFKKQTKDQILEPYYSKRGAMSPGFIANGYDPL